MAADPNEPTREELEAIELEIAEEEATYDEEAEALEWEIQYELEHGRT